MKQLLRAGHRILIKQITSILTRGQIYDEYGEFFIGLNNNINVEAMGMTTPSVSRMTSAGTSRSHSPDRERQSSLQVKTIFVKKISPFLRLSRFHKRIPDLLLVIININ
jgi:hypothetical protein